MANKKTHVTVGAITAGVVATKKLDCYKTGTEKISFLIGSLGGGYVGGRLPDLIDPPTSPNHRAGAHSLLILLSLAKVSYDDLISGKYSPEDIVDKFLPIDRENEDDLLFLIFRSALKGFIAGLIPGYLSHLALDMTTKKGLPLVK